MNFKTICRLKQQEQTTRITYENRYTLIIRPDTGELEERLGIQSLNTILSNSGKWSQICEHWEIYKLFFLLHNVNPDWIETPITTDPNSGKVYFLIYDNCNLCKTCHFS